MYESKKHHTLIVQKVMDMLEDLPIVERIITAAYYCDGFDTMSISKLLQVSETMVERKRKLVMTCFEKTCQCEVPPEIIEEAFRCLFRLRRYQLSASYAIFLYCTTCERLDAEQNGESPFCEK